MLLLKTVLGASHWLLRIDFSPGAKQNPPKKQQEKTVGVFVFQSALQSSPWGLMQALEQQVGELRIDTDDGACEGAQGDAGDSRPSSGTPPPSEIYSLMTCMQ